MNLYDGTKENINLVSREKVKDYIAYFNSCDDEFVKQYISNDKASDFLLANIPLLDCPDKRLEMIYYFRWWTLRKHIKETKDGFVFSEFLPSVSWAKKYNTIVCASGLHIAEARWLSESRYVEDYIRFWYNAGKEGIHDYTSWLPMAALQQAHVTGDTTLIKELLPLFIQDDEVWEKGVRVYGGKMIERSRNGLYYCYDFFDGGELSIGGEGYRPFFNVAKFASADAIAKIAQLCGDTENERFFRNKANVIKNAVQNLLWDPENKFFVVRNGDDKLRNVRELYGYSPWFFSLPDEGYADGFALLQDSTGFQAPYGPTVAEQRHPDFALNYSGHECQWNGPSWPFATSIVLGAMENLLNDYSDHKVTPRNYYDMLITYASSHLIIKENGTMVPWIDENINPYTGDWISRTRLKTWENGNWCDGKGGYERGKDYNHSMFCNHIINGLIGIRPFLSDKVIINPLVTANQWSWFCLENVNYHHKKLTVIWDSTGDHYGLKQGLSVFIDGKLVANRKKLQKIEVCF